MQQASWKVQMARGGWIAYLKFLQTSLSQWVSNTNGEAILALAQLSYASHLYKTSTRLNTKAQQQEKASYTPKQEDYTKQAKQLARYTSK